jgi:DNA-binding transcriptional LysR family regulator
MYRVQTMAVTVTQLAAFGAVVRHGSVTAAAEELVVTQPSVSAAVAALERELGVKLTERVGRNVRPTAAGEAYSRYAADILGLLHEGAEVAGEVDRGAGRRLRIAAVTTVGEHLLPPLIRAFREDYPELQVSLHVGNREAVFNRLATHQADVAVSGRPPDEPGFEGHAFADNEFVIITESDDPRAGRPWVPVEDLATTPSQSLWCHLRLVVSRRSDEHGVRARRRSLPCEVDRDPRRLGAGGREQLKVGCHLADGGQPVAPLVVV